ncbi:zinc-dependent alcohol dehydrogenase [Streptococcus henryi]|uniref:zinc-dependent alcohol dehydrogenase n=1 Tax=Streptococcus henryi TaxID=439219 RepID=UPI000382F156|nr:alcohol dehydrogenase catalytic domain-containing protein [Streptococcus henryi]
MKALIYYGPKDIKLEEREIPAISDKDVLVKVVRAGICGTDLTAYRYGGITTGILAKGQFGHDGQFGHEMVGIVEKVGEAVADVAVGDRVFINPTTCKRSGMLGCGIAGAFSEYVSVEEAAYGYNLFKLPDYASFDDTVIIEPLAVGTHAKNVIDVKPHEKVVIYGADTIGLCSLAACLAVGCVKPVVADVNKERLAMVEKMGGQPFLLGSDEELQPFLEKHFGKVLNEFGQSCVDVDAFIDAAGANSIPNDVINMAKKGARLSIVAIHKTEAPMDAAKILSKELTVKGACGYETIDVLEAFNHAVGKRSAIANIVTHHFPHEQAVEAFLVANDMSTGAIKVVIDFD